MRNLLTLLLLWLAFSGFGQTKPPALFNFYFLELKDGSHPAFISLSELGKNWENVWLPLCKPFMKGPKVLFPMPYIFKEDVEYLGNLAEQGNFAPLIDRIYSLDEIVEAYHYVESGQKLGNVVLEIN